MAAEARALLDAIMGADRNAPVPGASGLPSTDDPNSQQQQQHLQRRQKRSCYDPDICPLYCAWSLSDEPTWAESVAANEGAGGIDVYDLFTNTKSDLGPNPFRVDEAARAEFQSLPDHEKRRLGFEDMLCRKLADLVRQCDRSVARNKEKLRQEVARAMKARHEGKGRGNREDLITTINEQMLESCAANVAQAVLIEEELAELVQEVEKLEEAEKDLLKEIEEGAANKESANKPEEEETGTEEKKKKKKKKKDKEQAEQEEEVPTNPTDPRIIALQKDKLSKLLQIQSLSLQLPPLRDNTDNLLRQLQYLRSDTSTDKIVCEVSGNFMSSRDADERIAAHYAGKQYVGWKLVRDKLKELQKKGFGRGGGGGVGAGGVGGGGGGGVGMERGGYRDEGRHHGGYGTGGGGGGGPRGAGNGRREERWEPDYRDRGRDDRLDRGRYGGRDDRGYDRRDRDRGRRY
ncbi:hypothetical protein HJC23_003655 [Cyclotella cryptica]|uniref:Uncharacterized protein n=1 Tax=Cyclotella cryptica TaxID=29204 RepID=A0ABD3QJN1_9STRA|eukprot:CCRYP_004946-RA/>CCRYP_004946-RA protein AED:0.41 eAED:0.41 QI:0/-1/0/1/-1/1/1/0/460